MVASGVLVVDTELRSPVAGLLEGGLGNRRSHAHEKRRSCNTAGSRRGDLQDLGEGLDGPVGADRGAHTRVVLLGELDSQVRQVGLVKLVASESLGWHWMFKSRLAPAGGCA